MDISSLIPQLFYDVIGRIIPGTVLLATALILFEGPEKALRHLATWSDTSMEANLPIVLVLMGNLLAAHILASLLGGMWFLIRRGKTSEDIIEQRVSQLTDKHCPEAGNTQKLKEAINNITHMNAGDKTAFMYDYVILRCPKAGARIAKLRAEQHMSGVLMIGSVVLMIICLLSPYARQQGRLFICPIEFILLCAWLSAVLLARHLERRSSTALFNLWWLASSGNKEK